jgi:hypothetical protein
MASLFLADGQHIRCTRTLGQLTESKCPSLGLSVQSIKPVFDRSTPAKMKLTALLSSISLLAAGTFASPVTNSLETQRSEGEENLLETRDNGLKCASRIFPKIDYYEHFVLGV